MVRKEFKGLGDRNIGMNLLYVINFLVFLVCVLWEFRNCFFFKDFEKNKLMRRIKVFLRFFSDSFL